jgi:hypothetical protein
VLRADREHRHAFVARRQQAGDQVGGAGPRIAEHDCHLAAGLVPALGHVHRGRLVPDRDEADAMAIEVDQERVDLRARQPEDDFHAFVLQRASQQLATRRCRHDRPLS